MQLIAALCLDFKIDDATFWARLLEKLRSFEAYPFLLDLVSAMHDTIASTMACDPVLVHQLQALLDDTVAATEGAMINLDVERWLAVLPRVLRDSPFAPLLRVEEAISRLLGSRGGAGSEKPALAGPGAQLQDITNRSRGPVVGKLGCVAAACHLACAARPAERRAMLERIIAAADLPDVLDAVPVYAHVQCYEGLLECARTQPAKLRELPGAHQGAFTACAARALRIQPLMHFALVQGNVNAACTVLQIFRDEHGLENLRVVKCLSGQAIEGPAYAYLAETFRALQEDPATAEGMAKIVADVQRIAREGALLEESKSPLSDALKKRRRIDPPTEQAVSTAPDGSRTLPVAYPPSP